MNEYKKDNILLNNFIRVLIVASLFLIFPSLKNSIAQISESITLVEQFISPRGDVSGLCWDGNKFWFTFGNPALNVSKVNTKGKLLGDIWGPHINAKDICWDGEYLWIATWEVGLGAEGIFCVDTLGNIISNIPNPSSGTSSWDNPDGISWDGSHLWISNWNGELFKLAKNGTIISSYTSPDFKMATDLAWDGDNLWILKDWNGGQLLKINPENGELITIYDLSPIGYPVNGESVAFDGKDLWIVCGEPGDWDRFYKIVFSKGVKLNPSPQAINPLETWIINIESDYIKDAQGNKIPDNTLFTISTDNGIILDTDIDINTDGIQIASNYGTIKFSIIDFSGNIFATANSLDGIYSGTAFIPSNVPEYTLTIEKTLTYPITINSGNDKPNALTWDGHSFWVCSSHSIFKISNTGNLIDSFNNFRFNSQTMSLNGLVYAGEYLYLQADYWPAGLFKIAKIDTQGNVIEWFDHPTLPGYFGAGNSIGLAWDGVHVWACGSGRLEKISTGGKLVNFVSRDYFNAFDPDLAWDGQYIWMIDRWDHILKIDPLNGDILEQYNVPSVPWNRLRKANPIALTWVGSNLWIVSHPNAFDQLGYFFKLGGISSENLPPTLVNGIVIPTSGSMESSFVFEVLYSDQEGNMPSEHNVFIDDKPFNMEKISGTYTDGAIFQYKTNLNTGEHNYYFSFNDGYGHRTRLPATGVYNGPTVLETGIKDLSDSEIPEKFNIDQNYPNPFNSYTTFQYQVPKISVVSLQIYNLSGQLVKTIINKKNYPDYYKINWDGTNDKGESITSGMYICSFQAKDFIKNIKLIFIK